MSRRVIATTGVFDGVHRGHQALLALMRASAPQAEVRAVTFTDHPMCVIAPEAAPQLICDSDTKVRLLRDAGADHVDVLSFGEIRSLTATEYMQRLAADGVTDLVLGFNNSFGSDRLRTLEQYRAAGVVAGLTVTQAPPVLVGGEPVSSTRVRRALAAGEIAVATELLGHPYTISGVVGAGHRIGRTIGYPTANIVTSPRLLLAAAGVYAGATEIDGRRYPVMLNIGCRPTIDSDPRPTVEAHVIDFAADLYDRPLTVEVTTRLRDTCRFDTLDALRAQLDADRRAALAAQTTYTPHMSL